MQKTLSLIILIILVFSLMTSCGGDNQSADPDSAQSDKGVSQSINDSNEKTDTDNMAEEGDTAPVQEPVTLVFDPHVYQDPDNDDYLNALIYATNDSDKVVMVTIQYKAYDKDGNVISAFDQFKNKYYEQYKEELFIPAGANDLPVAFSLPSGYKYDYSTDQDMPEVDHLEYELLETQETDLEEHKAHFESGEPEVKENHIYIYVKFDQEIGDNYTSIYPDYTLLGYSDGEVVTVCCRNNYPYGTSSFSVGYAKENTDSSFLVYHHIPHEPVDSWELFLGCIGCE